MINTLVVIFIVLAIVGFILWGIQQVPGIPPTLLYCLSWVQSGGIHLGRFG